MTVLVDSDVIIEVLRRRDDAILAHWSELCDSGDEVSCSPVSHAEVWQGARPREHAEIRAFFDAVNCIPIDTEVGRTAGDLLRRYGKGHGIGLGDALIAATALWTGAALWTRNRKHYPMPELTFF